MSGWGPKHTNICFYNVGWANEECLKLLRSQGLNGYEKM